MTTTARQAILDATSEADLQRLIIETAHANGWRVHHDPTSRIQRADGTIHYATATAGDPGFPDLVIARRGVVIIVEVKGLRPRWKPGQKDWLAALGTVFVGPRNIDPLLDRLAWQD